MLLRSLRVEDFRNIESASLTPDPGFNVVVGANGQGKTNLLEAVFLLASLKPFRSQKNAELIRWGQDQAVIESDVQRGGTKRSVRVTIRKRGKRVELNDKTVRRLSEFFGSINVIVFSPEDIAVLRGSPGDRRLLLDRAIFHHFPAYADEVGEYETLLKNRNALLRGENPRRALVAAYDEHLIRFAAAVMERRRSFLDEISEAFTRSFAEIFDPSVVARVAYDPRVAAAAESGLDRDGLEQAMANALESSWERDLARGYTTVGPHRDDLDCTIHDRSVRAFASQGQHRAFMLAWKITEILHSRARYGRDPILVLDDVSSELDSRRNAQLFDFIGGVEGQVFISTTDASHVRLPGSAAMWHVAGGVIRPETPV